MPRVHTSLAPEEVIARLETAARRGKFAGFVRGSSGVLFGVRDFGGPFESVLEARPSPIDPGSGAYNLTFSLRLRTGLAWVYLGVLIATVWPGVWLTDSMLRTYFTGYDYRTWMWYLPLTVPFVPWAMWAAVRKSRRRGREAASEVIERIATLVGDAPQGASAGRGSAAATPGSDVAAPALSGSSAETA